MRCSVWRRLKSNKEKIDRIFPSLWDSPVDLCQAFYCSPICSRRFSSLYSLCPSLLRLFGMRKPQCQRQAPMQQILFYYS